MNKLTLLACSLALVAVACSSDTTPAPSSSSSGTVTTTLYDRLGKKAGIATAVDAIVAEELKSMTVAPFFANVGKTSGITVPQLKECLVNQLGAAAGGPKTEVDYPTKVGTYQCRDMVSSHTGLMITATAFDEFVTIAAGVLKKAGVADADIATVGGVLNGTKTDIVGK
jgi:truncated hemoglobin YjbI